MPYETDGGFFDMPVDFTAKENNANVFPRDRDFQGAPVGGNFNLPAINVGGHAAPSGLKMVRMVITETGTYNDQFYRPYTTDVSGSDYSEMTRRLSQFHQGDIAPSAMAGIANRLFVPSADVQGKVIIPNGWNERRLSFMLELEELTPIGVPLHFIFQGYTDYPGVTVTGAIDPQMKFIINSCITTQPENSWTPAGPRTMIRVASNEQYFTNPFMNSPFQGKEMYMERPSDVFLGIQLDYINQSSEGRVVPLNTNSQLGADAQASARQNNMSTEFLTRILNSYKNGCNVHSFASRHTDNLGEARNICMDTNIYDNPFIKFLSDNYQHVSGKTFQKGDLERLDPEADNKIKISLIGSAKMGGIQLHQTGQSENLHGSDFETRIANQVVHSVATLMSECLMTKISFSSSNRIADPFGMNKPGPVTTINQGLSFANLDLRPYYQLFITQFNNLIMRDISLNNLIGYELHATVDLFGESRIEIKIDAGPVVPFVFPSFCDNLYSPVLAPDRKNYENFISGMDSLLTAAGDVLSVPIETSKIQHI